MSEQRLEQLEKRIQRIEDVEAIKQLKYEYGMAADDNYNPDRLAALFTEDGVWDGGDAVGVHHGREAIRTLFAGVPEMLEFAIHYFMHPVIHVDVNGKNATGRWHMWQPCTLTNGPAVWLAGIEHDEYQKVAGEWLISKIRLEVLFMTPFDEGWQKIRLIEFP